MAVEGLAEAAPATGREEGGQAHSVPCPGAGCAGSGCAPGSQLCMCSVLCVLGRQVCLDSTLRSVCPSTSKHQRRGGSVAGMFV